MCIYVYVHVYIVHIMLYIYVSKRLPTVKLLGFLAPQRLPRRRRARGPGAGAEGRNLRAPVLALDGHRLRPLHHLRVAMSSPSFPGNSRVWAMFQPSFTGLVPQKAWVL